MSDKRKKIVIEGQDAGFSNMLKKLRVDSQEISKGMLEDAKQSKMAGRETLNFLEDQIKAIERRNRLEAEGRRFKERETFGPRIDSAKSPQEKSSIQGQLDSRIAKIDREGSQDQMQTKLLRDISETLKEEARQETMTNPKGVSKAIRQAERRGFAGLSGEDTAKLKYQKELMASPSGKEAVSNFAQVIGAGVVRDLGGMISQVPSSRSGLDLLTPFSGMVGSAFGAGIGAGAGGIAGALNSGTSGTAAGRGAIEGMALGSEIGKQVGIFAGQSLTRHLQEQEEYSRSMFQVRNLTGMSVAQPNLSAFGISASEGMGMMEGVVRSGGRSISSRELRNVVSMRSRGIDAGTASGFFGMERTGGGNANVELSRLIGVLEEIPTINRVIYNEIASNQLGLMQTMRQTRDTVSGRESLSMLMSFNKAGGQFGAKNPNSLQNMQSVMSSMQNPQNEFVQARQFGILREMFPGANIADLKDKMQNPTPEIMEAFLGDRGMEGLPDFMKDIARSQYTGGNIQRARSLSGFSVAGVDKFSNMDVLAGDASRNTGTFQKQEARIKDAFLSGPLEGLQQVTTEFGDTLKLIRDEEMKKIDMEKVVAEQLDKAGKSIENAGNGIVNFLKSINRSEAVDPNSIFSNKNGIRSNK